MGHWGCGLDRYIGLPAGLPGLQPGLQPGLKRGADAHRARCHINEAEAGGVRLDGEVSEADGGEGVEGEVEGVEVRPVLVVQPEGDRVAGLLVEARSSHSVIWKTSV